MDWQTPRESADVSYLFNDLHLTIEARSSALDKWNICSKAHVVDMPSCSYVIQRIEHNVITLEPVDVELPIHDIRMICFKLCTWLESLSHLLCYLCTT